MREGTPFEQLHMIGGWLQVVPGYRPVVPRLSVKDEDLNVTLASLNCARVDYLFFFYQCLKVRT